MQISHRFHSTTECWYDVGLFAGACGTFMCRRVYVRVCFELFVVKTSHWKVWRMKNIYIYEHKFSLGFEFRFCVLLLLCRLTIILLLVWGRKIVAVSAVCSYGFSSFLAVWVHLLQYSQYQSFSWAIIYCWKSFENVFLIRPYTTMNIAQRRDGRKLIEKTC